MKSSEILYNKTGSDESYTPAYAVAPLLKYIPKNAVVWCPFDTQESEFVKKISKKNKVIASHIDFEQDFLNYEPRQAWDMIISNPPFTCKRLIFERALSFKKPFALLMTCACLNDKYPLFSFKEANASPQFLFFDKRIHYKQNGTIEKNTTFMSAYFCRNFLPNQIVLELL